MVKSNKHKLHNNYLEEEENTGWFDEYVVYFQFHIFIKRQIFKFSILTHFQIRRILCKDLLTDILSVFVQGVSS